MAHSIQIKTTHYATLDAIAQQTSRFNQAPKFVKIKAHSNSPMNDLADYHAKQATNKASSQQILCTPTGTETPYQYTYMNRDKQIIDFYPNHYFAEIRRIKIRNDTTNKLFQIHPSIPDPDWDATIYLCNIGMGRGNRLDAKATREHSFRIKTLFRKLPTLDWVKKFKASLNTLCPRCRLHVENHDHLWECVDTKTKILKLQDLTTDTIYRNMQDGYQWAKIKDQKPPFTLARLIKMLGIDSFNFLSKPDSRGILTTSFLEEFTNNLPQNTANKELWIMLALDTWMSVFYKQVWINRNNLVDFNSNNQATIYAFTFSIIPPLEPSTMRFIPPCPPPPRIPIVIRLKKPPDRAPLPGDVNHQSKKPRIDEPDHNGQPNTTRKHNLPAEPTTTPTRKRFKLIFKHPNNNEQQSNKENPTENPKDPNIVLRGGG